MRTACHSRIVKVSVFRIFFGSPIIACFVRFVHFYIRLNKSTIWWDMILQRRSKHSQWLVGPSLSAPAFRLPTSETILQSLWRMRLSALQWCILTHSLMLLPLGGDRAQCASRFRSHASLAGCFDSSNGAAACLSACPSVCCSLAGGRAASQLAAEPPKLRKQSYILHRRYTAQSASACLSTCLPFHLSMCLSIHLPAYLSVL